MLNVDLELLDSMYKVEYESIEDLELIYKCINKYSGYLVIECLKYCTNKSTLLHFLNKLDNHLHYFLINEEDLNHMDTIVNTIVYQAISIFEDNINCIYYATNTNTTNNTIEANTTINIYSCINRTLSYYKFILSDAPVSIRGIVKNTINNIRYSHIVNGSFLSYIKYKYSFYNLNTILF